MIHFKLQNIYKTRFLSISPYSVRSRESMDQKDLIYGQFSRSRFNSYSYVI